MALTVNAIRPPLRLLAAQQRQQAQRVDPVRRFDAAHLQDGGHQVHEADEPVDQGDPEHLLVHGAGLLEVPVAAHRVAVVGGEDDHRVVRDAAVLDGGIHASQARIEQ